MSRQDKDTAKKKSAKYDPICGSRFVNILVNRMMTHGKKSLAYQIFYRAAIDIKRNTRKNPISVFRQALFRVTPKLIVKTKKRKKGKTFKVPLQIPFSKGALFGIRWLLGASRQRSGTNMASQLSAELRDAAFKKRGNAIRKKEQSHKMAEACRTFAHFRSSQSKKIPSKKFNYKKRESLWPRRLSCPIFVVWFHPKTDPRVIAAFLNSKFYKENKRRYDRRMARYRLREKERTIFFAKRKEERRIKREEETKKREEETKKWQEERRIKREEKRKKWQDGRRIYIPKRDSPWKKKNNQ